MQQQIRIVLVDDHEVVRESWEFLLNRDARFTVVGQCRNGEEAIQQAKALTPDVMLMDINMRPVNGFDATEAIMANTPSVKIIGLSANIHPTYADKILSLGAKGFVTKSSSFDELTKAILHVQAGGRYVCDEIKNDSSYLGEWKEAAN